MAKWNLKLTGMVLSADWTSVDITLTIERVNDAGTVTKTITKVFSLTNTNPRTYASEKEFFLLLEEEAMKVAQFARNAKAVEADWKGKVIGTL